MTKFDPSWPIIEDSFCITIRNRSGSSRNVIVGKVLFSVQADKISGNDLFGSSMLTEVLQATWSVDSENGSWELDTLRENFSSSKLVS